MCDRIARDAQCEPIYTNCWPADAQLMVIYLNEEREYYYWITHHRQGIVLDGRYKPKLGHLVLHWAACPQVKTATSKRSHWTTGSRFKACALDREQLLHWVETDLELTCTRCPECRSEIEMPSSDQSHPCREMRTQNPANPRAREPYVKFHFGA